MKPQTPAAPASVVGWNLVGEPGRLAKGVTQAFAVTWLAQRLRSFPLALLAWLPAGFLMVYLKWACLTAPGYSEAEVSGLLADRSVHAGSGYLAPLWARLGYLNADLILAFGGVPMVWMILLVLFGPRWGMRWILGCSLVTVFVLCIELQVLNTSSRFLAFEMAREAFEWAVAHRFQFLHYIEPRSLLLLGGLGAVMTWVFARRDWASSRVFLRLRRLTWGVYAVMLGLAVVSVRSVDPNPVPLRRSIAELCWIQWMDRPFIRDEADPTTRNARHLRGNGPSGQGPGSRPGPWFDPAASMRSVSLAHSDVAPSDSGRIERFSGKTSGFIGRPPSLRESHSGWDAPGLAGIAEGYDVIVWSLETAPARSFDLKELPALRRLSRDSWMGDRHFTTFPNTTHAHYSMLTGCYPPRDVLSVDRSRPASLPWVLRSRGYSAGIYGGENFDAANSRTYRSLGLDIHGAGLGDRQSLELLHKHVERHLERNQRFFAMFCPQIGHGPWEDSTNPASTPMERRRAILRTEDAWISSVFDLLKSRGRLDKTLLIVTGDHGVRDPAEDPAFRPGFVDEYSFHVPLVFFAPGIARGARLGDVTSHIDLAPTVLRLLGATSPGLPADGLPLWDASIRTRKTYFLGRSYLGADGYYDGRTSTFFMWNELRDVVMRSDSLSFQPSTDLVLDDAGNRARRVFRDLNGNPVR